MKNEQLISGVAQRYARSLFELAQEAGKTDAVAQELALLKQALQESREFRAFTQLPTLSAQEQIGVLQKLLPVFAIKNLTANFVQLLARNRRLGLLLQTIVAYEQLLARSKGLASAEVISAEPLTEQQTRALKEALKDSTGKDVTIESHVDQSLIGGLVVKLGSRMLDTSLKTKLSHMKTALKGIA